MSKIRWVDLNVKDKLAIVSALAAFTLGWALSIAAFIVPPMGIVDDGVLWILGQALLYAASVFGITGYFTAETVRLRHDMRDYINRRYEHQPYDEEPPKDE